MLHCAESSSELYDAKTMSEPICSDPCSKSPDELLSVSDNNSSGDLLQGSLHIVSDMVFAS